MSDDTAPDDVAEATREICLEAALNGYEDALVSGLCREGAWEAAMSAIRRVDLHQSDSGSAATERPVEATTTNESLMDSVNLLARQFASPGPPAAGSGAAATGAIAAGLLEWIALHSERHGPHSFRKRARAIRQRAVRLQRHLASAAQHDAENVERLIGARRGDASPEVFVQATESALAIADDCAQAVTLVAEVTTHVGETFRLDALVALRLAYGASQSAFEIFEENSRSVERESEWLRNVNRRAWRARLLLKRAAPLLAHEIPDLPSGAPS